MKMNVSSIDVISKRIYEITKTTGQKTLAKVLGLAQSSVSDAFSKKKKIPRDWFLTLYMDFKVNPFWIITGEDDKIIDNLNIDEFYKKYSIYLDIINTHEIINKPLENNDISSNLFTTEEPCNNELDCNISPLAENFKNDTKLLDNSSDYNLTSSIGFSNSKANTRIYTFEAKKPYTPVTINYSNYLIEDDFTRFYKVDSISKKNEIYNGIVRVDTKSSLNFMSNYVYVFSLRGVEVVLAKVELEDNKVKFIFANEEYPPYSCTIEEAHKDYLGKVVDIILNPIILFNN